MKMAVPHELSEQVERVTLARGRKRIVQRLFWVVSAAVLLFLSFAFYHITGGKVGHVNPRHVVAAVLIILALLMLLGGVVVHDTYQLWQRSKRSLTGTRMQRRIFSMFCAVSIVPTLIVTVFSVLFFNVGVNSWFDRQVSSTLEASVNVASAYLQEHRNNIRNHAFSIADAVAPKLSMISTNPRGFEQVLSVETNRRNLSEAVLFTRTNVLARTALSFSLIFERLPETVLKRAEEDVAVISQDGDKIQGVLRVLQSPDVYLLITRNVDATVVAQMQAAQKASTLYHQLQAEMNGIQLQFFIAFCMLALLMLIASIWAGMRLAARLIGPIAALNQATERVRAGDYTIRVAEGPIHDEVGNLARAFNRMTSQIEAQRRDLLEANRALDARRRFSETVLRGVSAGVLSLDEDLLVNLSNRRARALLQLPEDKDEALHHMRAVDVLPALVPLLEQVQKNPVKAASGDIVFDGATLQVRVTAERDGDFVEGYVVTFDDITQLVQAQRSAAWSDVARRVAHEIKNPLTPITLSIQRLKQKFAGEITSDPEMYVRYIDTVSRHVRDIGTIVDEFVKFARMPQAVLSPVGLQPLLRKIVFSEKTAHALIRYKLVMPEQEVVANIDESLLSQAVLNLLKNAAEALEGQKEMVEHPCITLLLEDSRDIRICIQDNGEGFPEDKIKQLMEPYVTTKPKGTGLGLAIVKKTVEEHGGSLVLENIEEGAGASACIVLPKLGGM